uniref:Inositol polyphosphate 1-phosphatase-like n=1 Tax=Geotrypetes seraphini TaxID=260995 RepID=A0A6P8QHX6_GEOSA|nr:inositol polyphosphate 1-phosphatase-like [Geotrypetes seraphini]XP_033795475.1 inositol polyphosphate 1-phosphatase-like [Geotrypetes seraphini]
MAQLLRALLGASEKAAGVAQLCRQQETLFQLLIEEKSGADKNKKFVQDFKTLADVIIQELIRHDIGKKFPELQNFIGGEESNKFENGLGETITMRVCPIQQETAALLCKILDQNQKAADLLAAAVHQDVVIQDQDLDKVSIVLPTDRLGIWIDPIDSTNQYIQGESNVTPSASGIYPSGLRSALVLVGVYDRLTGDPVLGVINEPFVQQDPQTKRWNSRYHWGISYHGTNICSLSRPNPGFGLSVVMSSSESTENQQALIPICGGHVYHAAGAGYKILCVILGLVDAYIFSGNTTFKWDTCGPHAILKALGGNIVDLTRIKAAWKNGTNKLLPELTYNEPIKEEVGAEKWANKGGVLAFMHSDYLETIITALTEAGQCAHP